jgi:hypothetical protein
MARLRPLAPADLDPSGHPELATELARIDGLVSEPGRSLDIVRPVLRAHAVHEHAHATPERECPWCSTRATSPWT